MFNLYKVINSYYHITPFNKTPKILKKGLVPKSGCKKFYHPERVYLYDNIDSAKALLNEFIKTYPNITSWAILEIDVKKMEDLQSITFYQDPHDRNHSMYALNTITPYAIKIIETINL